jgi:hypothetical protein
MEGPDRPGNRVRGKDVSGQYDNTCMADAAFQVATVGTRDSDASRERIGKVSACPRQLYDSDGR